MGCGRIRAVYGFAPGVLDAGAAGDGSAGAVDGSADGAAAAACIGGVPATGVGLTFERRLLDVVCEVIMARARLVPMNPTADHTVSLLNNVAAPRAPRTVWLPPPNVARLPVTTSTPNPGR